MRAKKGWKQYHFRQAACCDNVSRVHQAVEVPGRTLNGLTHIIVAVEVKDIRHQIERILVVLDLSVEASQVEAIRQVVLVDLAKVFVASR